MRNLFIWFIFFGTLLGIVREDSCIDGDNDVDIMINHDYTELRDIFKSRGFTFLERLEHTKEILKTNETTEFVSFDFYMCEVNRHGDFYTSWQNVKATKCYDDANHSKFITKKWHATELHLPHNYEYKLANMYGSSWKIPNPHAGSCNASRDKLLVV